MAKKNAKKKVACKAQTKLTFWVDSPLGIHTGVNSLQPKGGLTSSDTDFNPDASIDQERIPKVRSTPCSDSSPPRKALLDQKVRHVCPSASQSL